MFPKRRKAGGPGGGRGFLGVSSRRVCKIVSSAPEVTFRLVVGTELSWSPEPHVLFQPRTIRSLNQRRTVTEASILPCSERFLSGS